MRLTLVTSALTSILALYSSNALSIDVLSLNYDEHKEQVDTIDEKKLYKVQALKTNDYISYKSSIGRALVSGQAISYMWTSLDKLGNNRISDISGAHGNWGMTYDAMLRVGAELKSNSSGIKYGADFQVAVPSVKGMNFERKAALNRGSKIFAATPYGDFSIGYQEGVESLMKLDASNIIAGDESNGWTQHIRGALAEKKNAFGYEMYPFLLSPGLYSENVFRNNDNAVLSSDDSKDFVNNLPLRISYQSPSFMGLRFGVSYSPSGYKFDLFSKELDREAALIRYMKLPVGDLRYAKQYQLGSGKVTRKKDDPVSVGDVSIAQMTNKIQKNGLDDKNFAFFPFYRRVPLLFQVPVSNYNVFFGGKYEHILSGSVVFNYDYNNIKFSTSIVGEYAHSRLQFNAMEYNMYPDTYNLQGLSIGSVVNYNNINFAGAYGYLGESGIIKKYNNYYYLGYPLYERSNAYYWDAALGYRYKSYYFSVTYFKSKKSENILQDVSLGVEYNLLQRQGKMKCKLFGNYHRYKFSEIAVLNDKVFFHNDTVNENSVGIEEQVRESYMKGRSKIVIPPKGFDSRQIRTEKRDGVGNVLLIGVKLEF